MRKLYPVAFMLVSLLVVCILPTKGFSQQPTPDLSGEWKLNAKASRQGAIRGSELLQIEVSGNAVKMGHPHGAKDKKWLSSLVIDGKEHLLTYAMDDRTMAKAYWEGETLVIENHHHDNNRTFVEDIYFKYRYALSADPKNLIVTVEGMRPPVAGLRADLVYERQ
jgi:hypothetical protein